MGGESAATVGKVADMRCNVLVTGGGFGIWTVVAFAIIIGFLYLLFRPYKESGSLNVKVKGMAKAR